jgi:hypothetical protein
MNSASENYVRLPGVGHQLGSYAKLYRGPDHLLQISSVTFSEQYKRFYYRDIQAFIILPTHWLAIWIVLYLLVALLLGILAVGVGDIGGVVIGAVAGLVVFWAVLNAIRGPMCRCYVRTAVQTEKLPSLNRVRRARKVVAELAPLIAAAQPVPAPAAAAPEPVTPVPETDNPPPGSLTP